VAAIAAEVTPGHPCGAAIVTDHATCIVSVAGGVTRLNAGRDSYISMALSSNSAPPCNCKRVRIYATGRHAGRRFIYNFKNGEPCRGINVMFDNGVATAPQFFMCDD
jgi:hypothetical protein